MLRREFRHGLNLTGATASAYRTGFNTCWKYAGSYMARKGILKPGKFNPTNVHGGKMWGSRKECRLTDKMAGNILERVYESGKVGIDQLKQVRHSLSYAYYLTTGVQGENYPEVYAQWKSFDLSNLPGVRRPVKPTRIPTPANLKQAFTTKWTRAHPQSLTMFVTGLLCAYDTHVFGLRPNVDTKKVKDSRIHFVNGNEGYGWTQMEGGRSKLHGPKRGTRRWRVIRICVCKGKHVSVPDHFNMDAQGNPVNAPAWNTVCPVAAMELMRYVQGDEFKPYAKWFATTQHYGQNVGDVASYANFWLTTQGVPGPFDRSSGRKSLARWLDHLHVPYSEHLHIHGDLQEVWRGHYQSKLLKSTYKSREQSLDPDTVTAALKRFARWLHENGQPQPSLKEKLAAILKDLD